MYPNISGLKKIDHKRVPNLMAFFSRKGIVKSITKNPIDYTLETLFAGI